MTLPFDFLTIDAGGSYTNISNQAQIDIHNTSTYLQDGYASDFLNYKEKTKAGYLSLQHDENTFTIKAGLRYEHIGWGDDSRNYWLPSASVSYKPIEGHHILFSWGTSTMRPNFYDLNPFRQKVNIRKEMQH